MLHQFTADELRWAVDKVGLWSWDISSDEVRWSLRLGEICGIEPIDYPDNIVAFSALLPPEIEDLRVAIFESLDQKTGRFECEHPILRHGEVAWVRNAGRVEFDESNQPKKLVAAIVDVTTQKRAELSLQAREEQLRRFSELTSDYIYETDMTVLPLVPDVVAGSYERVVGYTADELAERGGWTGIMHADDLIEGQKVWEQLKNGVPTVHEYRISNAGGETRWLRDHCYPIVENGELVRLVGGAKDITETKALQDQLLQAQKHEAMAKLAGSVAHDFNNLLCVVMASAELMSDSSDAKDIETESLLADILVACNRATELTRSLLAFTRKDMPKTQVVRLSDTIRSANGILQRAVGEQIQLHIKCSHGVNDKVEIDPGHLQLILLNLATNARAAMLDRGELSISVLDIDFHDIDLPEIDSRQCVLLEIADTGCGITQENIRRVFEPFFTTKPDGEGFGIGLATCRQIIDEAGGTIHLKSRLGQGTTFSIYLPTVDKAAQPAPASVGNFSMGGKERILVVEDDSAVRRVSERILKSLGYEVSAVDCVEAAHQAIADKSFDLVLVDVRLPDGDGCSLASELSEMNPKLSVLLVSGYVDDHVRTRVRHDGHSVLPKPYSVAALARSVRYALNAGDK